MRPRFTPCSGCARHVREGDSVCPFCGAEAPSLKPLRRIAERLSRAAMHAAGAAGAVVMFGDCEPPGVEADYGFACAPDGCYQVAQDAAAESASDATYVTPDAGDAALREAGEVDVAGGDAEDAGPTDAQGGDVANDAGGADGNGDGG